MTEREAELRLRVRLAPPVVPGGLADRIVRAVHRQAATAAAVTFDIAASSSGIVLVRPGSGTIDAPTSRARAHAMAAREQLHEYLEGLRSYFTVPVDLATLEPFRRTVLATARTIPFGEVRSYQWIAERMGRARAVRAVGTALGRNPVPVIVPCHRVLRSDGTLGGYAFGLQLKERFLALERETPAIVGSATTRIVCRHGCPDEQRIADRHQVVFASLREARVAGYRPCRRCQPADNDE